MIAQLVRTELVADRKLLIGIGLVMLVDWAAVATLGNGASVLATIIGIGALAVAGIALTVRRRRQRRSRLLAQLPVTGLQVRVAGWFATVLVVALPVLLWLAVFGSSLGESIGWPILAALALLFFSFAIVLVALAATYGSVRQLRRPLNFVGFAAWGIAVLVLLIQFALFMDGAGPFRPDEIVNWQLLLPTVLGAAAILIAVDIGLDQLTENRLG